MHIFEYRRHELSTATLSTTTLRTPSNLQPIVVQLLWVYLRYSKEGIPIGNLLFHEILMSTICRQTDRQLLGQMDRVRKCHRGKRKWFTIVVNTHNEVEMREQKNGNGLSEFGHIVYLCWLSVNVVMMTGLALI